MKLLIMLLTIASAYAQESCNTGDSLKIKDTSFEEKILEHDPRLCFNKERLKGEPNLPYREKLKATFDKLDELYNSKLEIKSGKGNPLSAFRELDPALARTEVLGLTRMDTQSEQAEKSNRAWDYYALESSNRALRVRSPIHEFIGKSTHIDKDQLVSKVIEDMDRYSQKYNCQYGAQIVNHVRIRRLSKDALAKTNIKSKYATSREFKEDLKENKDKIEEIFSKEFPKEDGIKRNYNCADDFDTRDNSILHQGEDSCNIQISHQFENNSAEITADMLKENPGYQKFISCVNKKKQTQKLRDISIRSSANSIRNSGDNYGKYDWRRLSKDRAINAAKAIHETLGKNSSKESFDKWKDKYLNITSGGTNGDGTSGPCALEWKNGKVGYKPEYLTAKGKKSLEKFKSVYLSARFTQNARTTKIKPSFYYQKRCNELGYKCREYTPNDRNLVKRRRTVRQPEVFRSANQF